MKRYTAEEMECLLDLFAQSGLSQRGFCDQQGIKLPTFSYRYRKLGKSTPPSWSSLEGVFPNGVIVRGIRDLALVRQLVNLLPCFPLTPPTGIFFMARQWTCEKALTGLIGLVLNQLTRDPLSGEVYIFLNRQCNLIKLLHWENGGLVQYCKRLEKGTFQPPTALSQGGTLRPAGSHDLFLLCDV